MDRQMEVQRQISRFLENFRKIGRNNYTAAIVRSRSRSLKELWLTFTDGHVELKRIIPEASKATSSYFAKAVFEETEDIYNATLDQMAEVLEELEPPASPNRSADLSYARASPPTLAFSPLPSIQLPPFDGKVCEWESFRDRFSSVILDNKELTDFARMHYLISSLRGRALECISALAITAENFPVAWQELRDRYDDRRRLLSVHMTTLLNLPRLSRENLNDLQSLRGQAKRAITALRNLQSDPLALWNSFLIHVTSQSLDPITLKAWTLRLPGNNEPISYDAFDHFIADRIRALENMNIQSTFKPPYKSASSSRVHAATTSSNPSVCPICGDHHYFSSCQRFVRCNPGQRRDLVKKHKRCFNCLSQNHSAYKCSSKYSCRICQKRHHSLLHIESGSNATIKRETASQSNVAHPCEDSSDVQSSLASSCSPMSSPVMLATARVRVRSSSGRNAIVRVLLDQGSEVTLVTERLAQCLRAKRFSKPTSISAVGCVSAGRYRHAVNISILPLPPKSPSFATTAIVLPSLTNYTPRHTIDVKNLSHLSDLQWADPNPLNQDNIDVIIGADLYSDLLRDGVRRGSLGQPIAQETALGWIISGPVANRDTHKLTSRSRTMTTSSHHVGSLSLGLASPSLEAEIQRFWELESIPAASLRSPEEEQCEEYFKTTHSRLSNGRYQVRLPFKGQLPIALGASRIGAERSFASLSKRLKSQPETWKAYCDFLREYESLGHMRPVNGHEGHPGSIVYLPHHSVIRANCSTSRVRVVFNASSRTTNGSSLNDHLLTGPKLQVDIGAVILRWRNFRYAYCADIEKMYRQIVIDERDVDYQRILWSERPHQDLTEYQLLTVTYGMACAPFLALRVLQQLNMDEGHNFPLASSILAQNTYVDDVLFGGHTIDDAIQVRDQIISLLRRGGFPLRKWSANASVLLRDMLPGSTIHPGSKMFSEDEQVKILGIV